MLPFITLKKRSDFLQISKYGHTISTKSILFQVLESPSESNLPQVGFTVSKKISKLAVRRIRIKRRLKEACAKTFPSLADKNNMYVIIARKSALDRPFAGIIKDLRYALHQANELQNKEVAAYA